MLERKIDRYPVPNPTDAAFSSWLRDRLDGRPVILASNRGPVEYRFGDDGRLAAKRGGGGLVTACSALGRYLGFSWVAAAMTDGDRHVADRLKGEAVPLSSYAAGSRLRFVRTSDHVFHLHYHQFSNPLLWFLQHGMTDLLDFPVETRVRAWWDGYVPTNRAFAQEILSEAEEQDAPPVVMVHDYQLYLVPAEVRRVRPDATIVHFTHIPWPAADEWDVLPIAIRRAIVKGMLGSDIVGFQTRRDARRFLATVRRVLPQANVDDATLTVQQDNRRVAVRAYPISIDPIPLQQAAASTEVERYRQRLRPLLCPHTIVRVDRMDPSKNVLAGFRAFERMLRDHPELVGQTRFLAFLVPSRSSITEYRRYADAVLAEVATINNRYSRQRYRPIEVFHENNLPQALAGMSLADVVLVNSIADGMNLVAKEVPIVSRNHAALVLSAETGAAEQLGDASILVPARDELATASGLYRAVTMPEIERARRTKALRDRVLREDLAWWLRRQFEDLPQRRVDTADDDAPTYPAARETVELLHQH